MGGASGSLHKRPIEPRWFAVTGGVKKQIGANCQISQGKQIDPVAARQIGAVLHNEVVAQHATQAQQRITRPHLERHSQLFQVADAADPLDFVRCPGKRPDFFENGAGVNRQGRTSLTKTGKRRKPAVYPARPYMAPALQKAISRFTEAFRGTI